MDGWYIFELYLLGNFPTRINPNWFSSGGWWWGYDTLPPVRALAYTHGFGIQE